MIAALTHLTRLLSRLSIAFSAFGLVAMTAIIAWQVFGRSVLGESPAWSEQAALVLMVWYVTIAAAVGVREGFHIRLTALVDSMPPQMRRLLNLGSHLVVLLFGVALTIWGWELVQRTWAHSIPSLPVPRGFAYLPLPIAGALVCIFSLEHILAQLQNREVEPLWK